MKKFNLFLLIGLLIWSSFEQYGYLGYAVVGPFTASAFTCLLLPGQSNVFLVRAYQNSHSPPGIDPNALQTITNAFTAGYSASFYV
jgi:hypothetical protein